MSGKLFVPVNTVLEKLELRQCRQEAKKRD
jgi:hypothetical protein